MLLKCVAKHAKQLDLLHSILQEMRDRSFVPDLTTYTTVISALGSHGDVVGAQRIYSEIREQGLDPDMRLYNAMLEALSKGADGRTLSSFFEEMRQYGFRPDVRTFSIMLKDAYARGDYDLAVTFLAEIKRENIIPDVELCNALIRVGSRAEGGRTLVSEVIALMRRHRLEADASTHHTLIAAYALLGEAQLALATFEDMKQRVRRLFARSHAALATDIVQHLSPGCGLTVRSVLFWLTHGLRASDPHRSHTPVSWWRAAKLAMLSALCKSIAKSRAMARRPTRSSCVCCAQRCGRGPILCGR